MATGVAAAAVSSSSTATKRLHQIGGRSYTSDVVTDETMHYTFENLFLSPRLVQGLRAHGFVRPSPVQLHAIPTAKFGTDLIVQAKAGTGKTLVFAIVILESIRIIIAPPLAPLAVAGSGNGDSDSSSSSSSSNNNNNNNNTPPQAVIVSPTREITLQIADVIRRVGCELPALRVAAFIGGLSQKEDRAKIKAGCHVAAGSPGRL